MTSKINEILGTDDDVTSGYAIELLNSEKQVINLTLLNFRRELR